MNKKAFSTLGCHDRSIEEIISLAGRYRIDALEIRGVGGRIQNSEIPEFYPENIGATSELIYSAGLRVITVGTSAKFDSLDTLDANIAEALEGARVASSLGAPYIRVFGNKMRGKTTPECVAEGIAALTRRMPAGVGVLLEIHGDFNTVDNLMPVAERLRENENFGLVYDMAHADRGYGDSFAEIIDPLFPLIRHVHVKDHKRGDSPTLTPLGNGDIPILDIWRYLTDKGYKGMFSLEWERAWRPELGEIDTEIAKFAKYPVVYKK